jgi:hypothetical protein
LGLFFLWWFFDQKKKLFREPSNEHSFKVWRMQSDNIDSHYPLGLGQVS